MSYEVIKTIGRNKYRYSVESYRDPESGKTKTRWQYLGKAEGDAPPQRRARTGETRTKITSALERLLAKTDWKDVTAHDVALEAGVAPATLYRHFTSRDDVLLACVLQVMEALDLRFNELAQIAGDVETERARLRNWTIATVSEMNASGVLLALWSSGLTKDEMVREGLERRRTAFAAYLARLGELAYVSLEHRTASGLASALALITQAFSYRTLLGRAQLRADEREALGDAVERLIFA